MTVNREKIVKQREFKSLEEFISHQNNFYCHFLLYKDSKVSFRRKRRSFIRFEENFPELENLLTTKVTKIIQESFEISEQEFARVGLLHSLKSFIKGSEHRRNKFKEESIYEKLFEAYKIMSELVYAHDEDLKGEFSDRYLTA